MPPRFNRNAALSLALLSVPALALPTTGCLSSGSAVEDAAPELQTSETFTHDTRTVQKRCYHTGNCLKYVFQWPKDTPVTVELSARDFASVLISDHAIADKSFRPGADGVTRLSFVSKGRSVRFLVAAKNGRGGETALTVYPAPAEVRSQPKPPPTAAEIAAKKAARRADIEAKSKADYAKATAGLVRRTQTKGSFIERLPFEFKLKAGECYTVVMVRSNLVRRPAWRARVAATWRGMSFGTGISAPRRDSMVASNRPFCPTSKGKAELTWKETRKGDPSGSYTLELWTKKLTKAEFATVKQQAKDASRDLQAKLCVNCQVQALRCLKSRHGRSGCMRSFNRCTRDNGIANRCRFDR